MEDDLVDQNEGSDGADSDVSDVARSLENCDNRLGWLSASFSLSLSAWF